MRDDDEPAVARVEELLEPLEPVEVEVVRRLVEEQHVEAGEQDHRERHAGRLPARECRRRPVERDREAELGRDRAGPRVEIAAAERDEAVQGARVSIVRVLAGGQGRRGLLELALGRRDAGPACERLEQRLALAALVLLRQVARGQRERRPRDAAGVGHVQPGEKPEQGRLADPVRADDAEPPLGRDRERDAVENCRGAVVLRDAVE